MSKYTVCLFDLDGVLVDTAVYHFQAWRKLGEKFNFQLSEEQNEQLKGVSRVESLEKILQWAGAEATQTQKDAWLIEKNEHYLDLISNMNPSEILPGVLDFLSQIKDLGYQIGLGSASKNASIILEKTQLMPWFDILIDGNKVTKSKPDPEVFLKGAEGLRVLATACIVFEDAQAGIDAAISANMKTIGIGQAENLKGADKVIPSFEGINASELLNF